MCKGVKDISILRKLFLNIHLIAVRSNNRTSTSIRPTMFVGTFESAIDYMGAAYPYIASYDMDGLFMILNSPENIPEFNSFFVDKIRGLEDTTTKDEFIMLHLLLRICCGMANKNKDGIINYTEGYNDDVIETFLKPNLLQQEGIEENNLLFLDDKSPGLEPTRISIRPIDKYMARLANKLLRDIPIRGLPLKGIITSCREVGETVVGTNASIFGEHAKSVAVPGEFISFVDLTPVKEMKLTPENFRTYRNISGVSGGSKKKYKKKYKKRRTKRM